VGATHVNRPNTAANNEPSHVFDDIARECASQEPALSPTELVEVEAIWPCLVRVNGLVVTTNQ
jgi:hypothetical protein